MFLAFNFLLNFSNIYLKIIFFEVFKHLNSFINLKKRLNSTPELHFFQPLRLDITLFRLKHSITFSDAIRPICLPPEQLRNKIYDNILMTIVGWGETENGKYFALIYCDWILFLFLYFQHQRVTLS